MLFSFFVLHPTPHSGNGYTPIPEHSALYSDYTQYPAPQLNTAPSMQSGMPPIKHPGYAYSSGDGKI